MINRNERIEEGGEKSRETERRGRNTHIPGSVEVSRTLDVAELDFIRGRRRANGGGKLHLDSVSINEDSINNLSFSSPRPSLSPYAFLQ